MKSILVSSSLLLLAAGCGRTPPPPQQATPSPPALQEASAPSPTPLPFAQYPVELRSTTPHSQLRYAPSYKLNPGSAGLTAADVPGPDGIVYPDFSRAGLKADAKSGLRTFPVSEFGAAVNDDEDDASAFQQALDAAKTAGGGIVLLEKGVYDLHRPIRITGDHIHLRGPGRDLCTLRFDYKLEREEVRIVSPAPGESISRNDVIEIHSHPRRLEQHILLVNGKEVFRRGADTSGGDRFSLVYPVSALKLSPGPVRIQALVERFDGTRTESSHEVTFVKKPAQPGSLRFSHSVGAIEIFGDHYSTRHNSRPVTLTQPARRGDEHLAVSDSSTFAEGQVILLETKADEAFLQKTASARTDFHPKVMLQVTAVAEGRIQLDRPLRMDFPGSPRVRRIYPVQGGSVSGFSFEQSRKQWINAIQAHTVMNMQFRDLRIAKPGRNPITLGMALHCEIRDSEFGRPWYTGGGGTGYLGFSGTWESLIDNIDATELRHAPVIQAWASGNVFRNSRLVKSDANYHMLWAHENLIEGCDIDAARGSGSYGYAFFAQKPEMDIHGPGGGPRNVIYNNRSRSPGTAVLLGGSNENWIIVHNRFQVEKGPGMRFRRHSFDHIVWNNELQLPAGTAGFVLEDPDCVGIEVVGNRVSGADSLFGGEVPPQIDEQNHLAQATEASPLLFPPSLYEWQQQTLRRSE